MHDQRLRADAKPADRREILERIVWQLAVGVGRRDKIGVGGHQEGMAVGRCLGDRVDPDNAGAGRPVLDHDLLLPGLGKPLTERAGDHVGDAARRKRHDDVNGLGRIGLRLRGAIHAHYHAHHQQQSDQALPAAK